MGLPGAAGPYRLRTVLAASLVLSTLAVIAAIPSRWEGSRTAEEAYLPLRPLSVSEAVALLELRGQYKGTAILGLTADHVLLGTGNYLLPFRGAPGEKPVEGWTVSVRGTQYAMYSASWEPYYNLHRLPRGSLEQALGRALSDSDVGAGAFAGQRVSFVSHHLYRYVLVEIAALTVLLTGLVLFFQKTRSLLLVLPALTVAAIALFLFLRVYSPAFFDADWFHQRIVVERLALAGFALFWLGNPVGISGLCVVLYGLVRVGRALHARRAVSRRRYWSIVGASALSIATVLLVADFMEYRRERDSARRRLDELEVGLGAPTIALVKADPALAAGAEHQVDFYKRPVLRDEVMAKVDDILDRPRLEPHESVTVFVPLEGAYLFLWRTAHFRYADVRTIGRTIGQREVEAMLASRRSRGHGFLEHLRWPHREGRVVLDPRGEVLAVALVEQDLLRVPSLAGAIARFMWPWQAPP